MAHDKSQAGFMRWLGRQVGFVRSALSVNVSERAVYRQADVREEPMPGKPGVLLRRTTIDEVVVKEVRGQ